jgi:hypothetical protein
MVVEQPKFTRVEEPTLLCNQVCVSSQFRSINLKGLFQDQRQTWLRRCRVDGPRDAQGELVGLDEHIFAVRAEHRL